MSRSTGWYFIRMVGQRRWQCAYWDDEFKVWDAPTYVLNMNTLIKSGEPIEVGEKIVMPE